ADYELNYVIIELLGEWNDAVENDIMHLKRAVIDDMIAKGLYKFILITENVLNFHSSDDDYYQEWYEDIKDEGGWIVSLNMPGQTKYDFYNSHLAYYVNQLDNANWRTFQPHHFFPVIDT